MSDTDSAISTASDTPPPVGCVETNHQQEDNAGVQSANEAEEFVMGVVADRAKQARRDIIAARQQDQDQHQHVEGATTEGAAKERRDCVGKASHDTTSCEKVTLSSFIDDELHRLSSRLHQGKDDKLKGCTDQSQQSKTPDHQQDLEKGGCCTTMESSEDSAPAAAECSVSRPGAVHVSNPLGSDDHMGTLQDDQQVSDYQDHQFNPNNDDDNNSDCELSALSAHLVNDYEDDSNQGEEEDLSGTLDLTNSDCFGDFGLDGPFAEVEKVVAETTDQPWFLFASVAGIALLMLIILLLVLGLAGVFDSTTGEDLGLSNDNKNVITPVPLSKLERIRQEGVLKCAYNYFSPSPFQETLCKVIAAAIMGEAAQVEYTSLLLMNHRFEALANGEIDVLIRVVTHTMERDIHDHNTGSAFTFSTPYMYDGMKVAGDPFFVQCAENNLKHIEECSDLKICVHSGSTHITTLSKLLPERYIVPSNFLSGKRFVMEQLATGTCNVVGMESEVLAEFLQDSANEAYNFTVTERYFSKDPLSMVTSSEDPAFSDFVNAVLEALLVAEKHDITQDRASSFPTTTVFGDAYQKMFQDALAVGGHLGELYENLRPEKLPRDALNQINDGTTGLIFSHPFGLIEHDREGKPLGPYMQGILDRGFLRCGLQTGRPGFAHEDEASGMIAGMDAEYCCAVAAALFQGDKTKVEFVHLESASDGYVLLAEGSLDLVAGASRTLENDVREPSTGLGFAFSQPYFYGHDGDNLSLATRQEDKDWSSFVYWIVGASFYAEENSITSALANPMPEVFVFGQKFHRMFRDSVLAVGSYSEMYNRNLEPIIPRSGRNQLNAHPNLGPQHYPLPGFFLSE